MKASLSSQRIWMARLIAVGADALQIGVFPLFIGGIASPAADFLDVVTAIVMFGMLGWHWAFVPTFLAELLPGLDLFPTWTAAVFFATWGGPQEPAPGPPKVIREID